MNTDKDFLDECRKVLVRGVMPESFLDSVNTDTLKRNLEHYESDVVHLSSTITDDYREILGD